jgi:hypothetical protein
MPNSSEGHPVGTAKLRGNVLRFFHHGAWWWSDLYPHPNEEHVRAIDELFLSLPHGAASVAFTLDHARRPNRRLELGPLSLGRAYRLQKGGDMQDGGFCLPLSDDLDVDRQPFAARAEPHGHARKPRHVQGHGRAL